MPEGKMHLELRTFLFALLKYAFGTGACVGSEQFVYWNARDPKRKLSPDVFVRRGRPDESFGSWKTWERGAPELAVEIVSPNETEWLDWEQKLERFHEVGVDELVRFDPEAAEGERLRVWDRVEGDLVEREVEGDRAFCRTLQHHWVVVPVAGYPAGLRLARDAEGKDLLPTELEAAHEARRTEAEARRTEAEARLRAEERIRALEEELARRAGG